MQPIGPLMIEHRLIERMIHLLSQEVQFIDERAELRLDFIETAVDFIKTYADRTHHGKEEDILFRDLQDKVLSPKEEKQMQELIEEHKLGRRLVGNVVNAMERYRAEGQSRLVADIRNEINAIVEFYPPHIEKEDKEFFPAAMQYFSKAAQEAMLSECREFDQKMIHEKYRSVVEQFEASFEVG